jgi:protein TonB
MPPAEPVIRLPDPPPVADAVVVPPVPVVRPRQEPPKPARPQPDRPRPPRRAETRSTRPPAPRTSAPQRVETPHAAEAAAPVMGAASAATPSPASWRGLLGAHINRFKRAPSGGASGMTQVVFTIDRAGRVLSARLASSSGDPGLDSEAVAMMRRASPVPAPPAAIGGATVTLVVPVRFDR